MSEFAQAKADLVPYTAEYASVVRGWIDTEQTYHNLSRSGEFPPVEDVVESWQGDNISSYLLFTSSKPVAYGELWSRPIDRMIEIAHLLVYPSMRLRGYGTRMLELLYQRGAERPNVAYVFLNLYGHDEITLGCYLKAGFEVLGTTAQVEGLRMVRRVE